MIINHGSGPCRWSSLFLPPTVGKPLAPYSVRSLRMAALPCYDFRILTAPSFPKKKRKKKKRQGSAMRLAGGKPWWKNKSGFLDALNLPAGKLRISLLCILNHHVSISPAERLRLAYSGPSGQSTHSRLLGAFWAFQPASACFPCTDWNA